MRLLKLQDDGELSLAEFVGDNIPPYAILSHTWGDDHEEVTFKDLVDGSGKSKTGYTKIRFCTTQAAKDGLQYFWADTCCIDKSSSAELSEAINSMFLWYHHATTCYVYLSDVSINGAIGNSPSSPRAWRQAFQQSRWFTRGWTLQELVAPTSVEFFSVESKRLGDKISLVQEIRDITGIPVQALQGSPLSRFSVDERMSWAERRETKREEDAAYSLLGIFDIHMPLLYGEGRKKALIRLQKEIKESLEDELPALPLVLSTRKPKRNREPFSTVPLSQDPNFMDRSDSCRQMIPPIGLTVVVNPDEPSLE
ncbi:heterokaryon incompatibility protein-domain-containing protein [Cenococcum geophilum]